MQPRHRKLSWLISLWPLWHVSSLTTQPLPTNTRGDLSSLRDWATEKGVTFSDGVGFAPCTDGEKDEWQICPVGDNLSNNVKLKQGTVLLSVPKSLVFNSIEIEKELEGQPLKKALKTLGKRTKSASWRVLVRTRYDETRTPTERSNGC